MDFVIKTIEQAEPIDALIIPCFKNGELPPLAKDLDQSMHQLISELRDRKEIEGKQYQLVSLHTHKSIFPRVLVLLGLGEKNKFNQRVWFQCVASALSYNQRLHNRTVGLHIDADYLSESLEELVETGVSAVLYGTYSFDHYRTKAEDHTPIEQVHLFIEKHQDKIETAVNQGRIIGEAVTMVRDLVNHPANIATPTMLAEKAQEIAQARELHLEIFGRREIEELGMHAFASVSKGSHEPPKFIVFGHRMDRKALPTVVLIGKGVTFDSGGISIKPSNGMHEMKMDMAGGAAVLGIMQAASQLDLPLRIIGLIPATENLPGGMASKPGDIVKAYNGKTIEILNTDAEGRVILADALAYGQQFKPDCLIDLATLTGACVVALGHEAAAVLGNHNELLKQIGQAAQRSGERVWNLPLWDEYKEAVKSDIADVANTGKGAGAGTITGAAFLSEFVGEYPWAHLDIAGTAYYSKPKSYAAAGASGFGVRLVIDFLKNYVPFNKSTGTTKKDTKPTMKQLDNMALSFQ